MLTDCVALTQKLVRMPSISGTDGQQRILALLGQVLRQTGFLVRIDDSDTPRFLLATTDPVNSGPVLLVACHVDTVPAGDFAQWERDPFSGEISEGRVWGRGASDMKGGLVAVLQSGPQGPRAALLLTTNEEVGCRGVAAAADALAELDVAAIVVPESTNNRIVLGHRGTLWLKLTTQGVAALGAPHLGKNALLDLASSLLDIDARLPRGLGDPILGATTVNVGTMVAGTAPNIVPEHATAAVDIRFGGADEPAAILAWLAWLASNQPRVEVTSTLQLAPLVSSPNDPWIRFPPAVVAEPPSATFFTDAAVLASLFPRAPVAIWGPGQPGPRPRPRRVHVSRPDGACRQAVRHRVHALAGRGATYRRRLSQEGTRMSGRAGPGVPTEVPAGLIRAQELARAIVTELGPFVRVGVTEVELDEQATKIAAAHGSGGFWSPSTTRVGLGTLVAHPDFPMQDRQAKSGDTVIVDIACALDGWCGDHCTTFTIDPAPETSALVHDCYWVYERLTECMRPGMPACELYRYGAGLLRDHDLKLLDLLDNFGHSIGQEFAAEGFIDATNQTPMWGGWTLEPHVGRHARGAKFEEIVWLSSDGSMKVV